MSRPPLTSLADVVKVNLRVGWSQSTTPGRRENDPQSNEFEPPTSEASTSTTAPPGLLDVHTE